MKERMISDEALDMLEEEAVCDHYGWTHEYVRRMPDKDFRAILNIIAGKAERKQPSGREMRDGPGWSG